MVFDRIKVYPSICTDFDLKVLKSYQLDQQSLTSESVYYYWTCIWINSKSDNLISLKMSLSVVIRFSHFYAYSKRL